VCSASPSVFPAEAGIQARTIPQFQNGAYGVGDDVLICYLPATNEPACLGPGYLRKASDSGMAQLNWHSGELRRRQVREVTEWCPSRGLPDSSGSSTGNHSSRGLVENTYASHTTDPKIVSFARCFSAAGPYNLLRLFINAPVPIARTGPYDSEDLMVRKTPQLGKRILPDA